MATDVNQEYSFIGNVNLLVENLQNLKNISQNLLEIAASGTNIESIKTNSDNMPSIQTISSNIEAILTNSSHINTLKTNSDNMLSIQTISSDIEAIITNSLYVNTFKVIHESIEAIKKNNEHIEAIKMNSLNIESIETNSQHIEAIKINAQNKEALFKINLNIDALVGIYSNLNVFLELKSKATNLENLFVNLEDDFEAQNNQLEQLLVDAQNQIDSLDSLVATATTLENDIANEKSLFEEIISVKDKMVFLADNLENIINIVFSKELLDQLNMQVTTNTNDITLMQIKQNRMDLQIDLNYAKTLSRFKILESLI